MHKITVNGASIAYDEAGTGSPVVLLHAGIADRRMWRGQLSALAARHRVIVPDLRGYGDSELPPTPFAHRRRGRAAGRTRPASGRPGWLLLRRSGRHRHRAGPPDRVSALALFDTAVSGNEWSDEANDLWDDLVGEVDPDDFLAGAAGEVRFWVVGPGRQPADVDPELIAFAQEMDRRALAAELALGAVEVGELTPPAIGRLGELTVPVLVTAGAADVPDISRLADRIAAEVPGAVRLPDVPNAAHLLPLERPEPVNAALLDFLS
ncbi:alpha/beta hydrolase [Micromonospora sp. M12]